MVSRDHARTFDAVTSEQAQTPVAWRVKDFADGWILFHTESWARREAEGAGNLVQPLYLAPAVNSDLLEALKAALHALVTTENLRATDLTQEIFDAHLGNGVPRDQLEWAIDNTAEIARAEAAIKKAAAQ